MVRKCDDGAAAMVSLRGNTVVADFVPYDIHRGFMLFELVPLFCFLPYGP